MLCCSGTKVGAAGLVAIGVAAGFALNEGTGAVIASQPEGEMAQPEMSMEEMMAAWEKLGTPNEHHERLGYTIGEWDVHSSFNMPDGSTMESGGHMTSEWVFGGRFVKTDFHLDNMMGQPFDGVAYVGYDNETEEYTSVWMDSMSTKTFLHTGWFDGDRFITKGKGAMGSEMKIVSTKVDENTIIDTFYERWGGGEWTESGTSRYTRR